MKTKSVSKSNPVVQVYTWACSQHGDATLLPDGTEVDLPVFWIRTVVVRAKRKTHYISSFGEKIPVETCSPTAGGAKALALAYIKKLVASKKAVIAKEKVVVDTLEAIHLSDIGDGSPWSAIPM